MRWLFGVLLIAGCIEHELVPCGEDLCPRGQVCTPGGCARPADVTACDGRPEGDACSSEHTMTGACHDGACHPIVCGDEVIDIGEACDDGNIVANDGCSATCDSTELCGNQFVDIPLGEGCDSGVAGLSHDGCASTCVGEIGEWIDISPQPIAGRLLPHIAYDAARGEVVVFGGYTKSGIIGDTWVWNGLRWLPRITGAAPASRAGAAFVYDAARKQVLLFGGNGHAGLLNDTWVWNGLTWTELHPAVSPSPRGGMQAAYDSARQRVVLFSGYPYDSETWEWDGTTWALRVTTTAPPGRIYSALVYDEARDELVLYGGMDNNAQVLRDTWTLKGATWTQRAIAMTAPTAGAKLAMAYDSSRDVVVLFGGADDNIISAYAETWEWNGAWTKVTVQGPSPPGRQFPAAVYDPEAQQVLLFGGGLINILIDAFRNDTWYWNGVSWTEPPAVPLAPSERATPGMVYDERRGELVMFGGINLGFTNGETWRWRAGVWTRLLPAQSPSARANHSFVYDRARDRSVLFGGISAAVYADTWEWDGTTWLERTPSTSPPARNSHAAAYDLERERVVIFGGGADNAPFDDTWEWDGTTWVQIMTPSAPSPRSGARMAYDARRRRMVLFGGSPATGAVYEDTWEYDGATWTQIATPELRPAPRAFSMMVYDPVRERVVLTGGIMAVILDDTWEWDGQTWQPQPQFDAPAQAGSGIAYNAIEQRIVMFGGLGLGGIAQSPGTVALQFTSPNVPSEVCLASNIDDDRDTRAGCADPDCWGRCSPLCVPGTSCPSDAPRCGDGTCSPVEDNALCPNDCGPAP